MFCQFTRKYVCSFIFIVIVSKYEAHGNDQTEIDNREDENVKAYSYITIKPTEKYPEPECWLNLKVNQLFDALDTLEEKYQEVREDFLKSAKRGLFNDKMFDTIVNNIDRRRYSGGENINILPAGINLGGYSTVKLTDSIIFFHLMKLMSDTYLRVNFLHNDLTNMLLTARFSVQSLRLSGSYERAKTEGSPFNFVYKPNVGNIEVKFTNVRYKVEARYRLVRHHLHVEHVRSELTAAEMKTTFYTNGKPEHPVRQEPHVTDGYLVRMKTDMDVYIKDYLNNHLRSFNVTKYSSNITELQNYDQEKALILNEWVDQAISQLRTKMHRLKVTSVKQPHFNIYSPEGMIFQLKGGVLRGLDSIHRRSVATVKQEGGIRHVDVILGFSTLLLKYEYEARMNIGNIPDTGALMLNADDLTAHLSIAMVPEPETADVQFRFYKQAKSEYLVIGGDINRKLVNYKHLIQNQVLHLMTSSILATVTGLKHLTKCHSSAVLTSHVDRGEMHLNDDDNDHSNVTSTSNKTIDQPDKNKDTTYSTTYKIATNKMGTFTTKDTQDPELIHYEALKRRVRNRKYMATPLLRYDSHVIPIRGPA